MFLVISVCCDMTDIQILSAVLHEGPRRVFTREETNKTWKKIS